MRATVCGINAGPVFFVSIGSRGLAPFMTKVPIIPISDWNLMIMISRIFS
jgi:hypothetical protein